FGNGKPFADNIAHQRVRIALLLHQFLDSGVEPAVMLQSLANDPKQLFMNHPQCFPAGPFAPLFVKPAGIEQIFTVRLDGEPQFLYPDIFDRNGFIYRGGPVSFLDMGIDFQPRVNFCEDLIGALPVSLVHHEHIGYLHDTGLHALYRVSKTRHQDKTGGVGDADYVDLILSDADSFNHDHVLAKGVQDLYHVPRGFGYASEKSTGSHAPDINIGIIAKFAHPDP